MSELFATELDQATLRFEAWQNGLPVEANPNIQPAAVLAVRNVVAPPANTSTSPGHAPMTGPPAADVNGQTSHAKLQSPFLKS
jgi:hypothetical protein